MPLGLLMVARGQLTYAEVAAALEAQQRARYGTIGEWIEKLGFATEQDVTTALALQWGCPLATSIEISEIPVFARIPLALLVKFQMLPMHFAARADTLYLACGRRVDHGTLYAVEQMIGCRIQPCAGGRQAVAAELERLSQKPPSGEVEFRQVHDVAEMSRIALSYITRLTADEVRSSRIGPTIWLRLRARASYLSLVFHLRNEVEPSRKLRPEFMAGAKRPSGNHRPTVV